MKMKSFGFVLILIFFSSIANKLLSQFILLKERGNTFKYEPINYTLNYEEIEGNAYLNEKLIEGYVKFVNGDTIAAYMRYNIYEDGIEYLDGENIFLIDNVNQLDHVYIGSDNFVYLEYQFGNEYNEGYLIEKVSGNCKLYLKPVVKFEEAEAPLTGYHQAQPPTFQRRPSQWYVSKNNGPVSQIDLTKSDLKKIFGNQFYTLDDFKKREKLKLRNEEDVVTLFEYFNSIN